ncbi:phosphatase PAP2 family protein [Actinoplanes sp. CA-142083]|uniref:phosphatase PAP2 family protein n=1 Tax=Actinoplanes sp. CA-142083 TaxID=3239903 RepID=UPI003D89EF94
MKPSVLPAAPVPTARRAEWRRALREIVFVAVLFLAYKLGRILVEGHVGAALTNAQNVWDFERLVHLPSEASLQAALLSHTFWVRVANCFYAYVHFPATAAALIWLYLKRPEIYVWFRRSLASLTALALVIHALFPLAPPRMLTSAGMVDTGHRYGPSVYGSPSTDTLSNQYAAMPSLHVGWALAVAIALIAASRSRWRWLWLAHPLATLTVVVVTGNHYWLDAIAAVMLLALVLAVVTPLSRQPAISSADVNAGSPPLSPVAAGLAAIAMPSAVPLLRAAADRGADRAATGWDADRAAADRGGYDGAVADRAVADRALAGPASVGGHPIVGWKLADSPRPVAGRNPGRGPSEAVAALNLGRDPSETVAGRPVAGLRPVAELRTVSELPSPERARAVPGQRTVVMAELVDSSRVPVTTCSPRERIDGDAVTRPPGGLTTTRPGPSAPRSRHPHSR